MKKRILAVALAVLLVFGLAVGCKRKPDEPSGEHTHNYINGYCSVCGAADPDFGKQPTDEAFSYYAPTELRSDKKLYVVNTDASLTNDDLVSVSAVQGLFARKENTLYIDGKYMTNGVNADMYYLDVAEEKYGIETETVSLEQAVQLYIDAWDEMTAAGLWGSKIDLATGFTAAPYNAYSETNTVKPGYASPGYIVYNTDTYSLNIATTLAGITGFIPVASTSVELYQSFGLVEKMNVSASTFSYRWLFDACMAELSPKGLVHQDYDLNGETNYYMRDYGVTQKYMHVYYDNNTTINGTLKKRIHDFLDKNIPILGYAHDEVPDVALFSQYGQFLVPTDYTMNLSVHLSKAFRTENGFTQPNNDREKAAEQGKHYVAFVVSDGDNAQYWQNTAIFSTNYMRATGREKDDFAVTWSITPSLSDMMPLVMDAAYNGDIPTENDYFCAPVSGQGYIDAGNFYNAGASYMQNFLSNLDVYMKRAGLHVSTIIGAENYTEGGIFGTMDAYASVPALEGGLVLNGNKYFGGAYSGGVYWKNGKPFIVPRDSLWSTTPAYLAARINMYAATETGCDVTTTDAYSVINVHPWSHEYADIRTICGMLNDNVEVVSLDRIVAMMRSSVTDKADSVDHFTMPVSGSGQTIKDSDLQKQPELIPTNPLRNDFLLWCEDWKGDVTYRSSDLATSDVYPAFKTNMEIKAKGRATKDAFTLPDVDNVWISFYVRANSISATASTSIKLTATVDGTPKTILEEMPLRGVSGTETPNVSGDGWQTVAFPLAQYFPDYRNKQARFEITVLGDVGVKVDQFTVTDRFIVEGDDTVCKNPLANEFEDGSTEDWMLGDQFKTSQYYHWSAIDRATGKPAGALQVDASDGGGNEKRNANTNVWFAKRITFGKETDLSLRVFGGDNGGAKAKLALYVDGQYIVLVDWNKTGSIGEQQIDLAALCTAAGIDTLEGKQATFVFEVRDSATNNENGAGQDFNLDYFRLTQKA